MKMDEMTMTLEEAVNEYTSTAQQRGYSAVRVNGDNSEPLQSGGWLLRDSEWQVITIVEPDGSVLASLGGVAVMDKATFEAEMMAVMDKATFEAEMLKADEKPANSAITRIIPLWDQRCMFTKALHHLDGNDEIRQSDVTHMMAKIANTKYPAENPWTGDDFNEFAELALGFTWGFPDD